MRAIVGALGWTGHTYPALALARELSGRGHELLVEAPQGWRDVVEDLGLRFSAAEDSIAFAGLATDGAPGPTLPQAVRARLPLIRDFEPDVVVNDVFTLAPALAAESAGVRSATLVPHLYPVHEPGLPLFPYGLHPPRTPLAAAVWRAIGPLEPLLTPRLGRARRNLNEARAELGLAPSERLHGAISDRLAMVATYPQLEYPRRWPAHTHVTGPMLFELEDAAGELPVGEDPLVLVHSSTAQDPKFALVRTALEALADEPVRVVATMSRRGLDWADQVPANAVVTDWVSYSQVLPQASLVVCSGGHGAVARILAGGVPLLICPPGADMAENGARVAWAGAGLMLPKRLLRPGALRWAVRRILADGRYAAGARAIAAWGREHDGATVGADLVERYGVGAASR